MVDFSHLILSRKNDAYVETPVNTGDHMFVAVDDMNYSGFG